MRFASANGVHVSETDSRSFAEPKRLIVTKEGSEDDTPPSTEGNFFKTLKGLFFASVALTLLGSKK